MSDELKPVRCGCGGEARIDAYLGDLRRSNLYYIYCAKCDIRTSNYLSEAEVITAWNKAMGASAEPERKIIYCKDCRFAHFTTEGEMKYCDVWFPETKMYLSADDFCSSAEKRGE